MFKNLTSSVCITAVTLALGVSSASAAVVTQTFTISTATIADIYSATFDSALTPCGGSPTQECTFFNGSPPSPPSYHPTPGFNRHVKFTNLGTGTGFMTVDYENTTGEIQLVRRLRIHLPNVDVDIDTSGGDHADIAVTQHNSAPVVNDFPFIEAGTGTLGRDIDGSLGVAVGQGTADADEGVAVGQAAIFQHDDQPNADNPDFAIFVDIVDTCVDPTPTPPINDLCQLIPLLNLDGIRYRLEGTVSAAGSDALVLKHQTSNNSILTVNFATAVEPADADGDGVDDGLDNCRTLGNATQCDSNSDGFGNRCDGDLNGNNVTNSQDYAIFRSTLGTVNANSDLNCGGGNVNSQDYAIFRTLLGSGPGPSGHACAGIVPCPQP